MGLATPPTAASEAIGASINAGVGAAAGGPTRAFVGFSNYRHLFTSDPVFWGSARVTFAYSALASPVTVAVALGLAFLLKGSDRRRSLLRTACFLPSAISMSVVAVVWGLMLDPYYGLANSLLRAIGLPPQPFLNSPRQALACLIAIAVWRNSGYWMMFFLAGMQGIPREAYEAAALDGASKSKQAWHITIPLLARTVSFVLVSNTAFNFLTFAPVFILTKGGPIRSTNVLVYESYKSAFIGLDMGRATAISSLVLAAVLLLSLAELRLTRAKHEY